MPQDETYCELIRKLGKHGTWEPGAWLLPGDCGPFQRGVFQRSFALSVERYQYSIVGGPVRPIQLKAATMRVTGLAAGVAVNDPLKALAAGGSVTYRASQANEVVLLAPSGRTWQLENVNKLLEQVRDNIERFPVNFVIVCEVSATTAGVAAVSSSDGQEFSVGLDFATGLPTIGVKTAFGIAAASQLEGTYEFSASKPRPFAERDDPPDFGEACMPLFAHAYRVKASWLPHLGRRHLVTMKGDGALIYRGDSSPEPLVPDRSDPEINLDRVKALPVHHLFEVITPKQLSAEIAEDEEKRVH
jgi:hypothetical protein